MLSTGMKNLMNYLFFAEHYEDRYKKTGYILDISNIGHNAIYYLFKYANYFSVPFFFDNATMGGLYYKEETSKETDPILKVDLWKVEYELNGEPTKDVWDFLDKYEEVQNTLIEKGNQDLIDKLRYDPKYLDRW